MLGACVFVFSRAASPQTRRKAQPYIAVAVGLVFLGLLYVSGGRGHGTFLSMAAMGAAIIAMNGWGVRICPKCGATNYPNFLSPPAYCRKCGTALDDKASA